MQSQAATSGKRTSARIAARVAATTSEADAEPGEEEHRQKKAKRRKKAQQADPPLADALWLDLASPTRRHRDHAGQEHKPLEDIQGRRAGIELDPSSILGIEPSFDSSTEASERVV
jgi:hypothetical protein